MASGLTTVVGESGIPLESNVFETETARGFSDLFIGTGETEPLVKPSAFRKAGPGSGKVQSSCSCQENAESAVTGAL